MKNLALTAPRTLVMGSETAWQGIELLEVEACGICRSDHKAWSSPPAGLHLPRILGHEVAGRLLCDLPHLAMEQGQPVVLWPALSCGACRFCLSSRANLCLRVRLLGYHLNGGFSEKIIFPRQALSQVQALALPEGLSFIEASLAEPLGCVVNALVKVRQAPETALVLGAGFMGRLAARCIEQRWSCRVLVSDPEPERLAAACKEQAPFSGEEADLVLVAASDRGAVETGISHLAAGGAIVLFSGLPRGSGQEVAIPHNRLHQQEQTLVGAYGCTPDSMAEALELMAGGLEVADLISSRVRLHEVEEVLAGPRPSGELKVVVEFG